MAQLQLIISPVDHHEGNFLLDIAASSPVTELRTRLAAKLGVPPSRIKLVSEGIELEDGATLNDFYLVNLSTVRLVVTPATGDGHAPTTSATATAPPAATAKGKAVATGPGSPPVAGFTSVPLAPIATASGGPTAPVGSPPAAALPSAGAGILSDAEMPRAVVVTNIPSADPIATEKCLFDTFSAYGDMSRVIFQDDRQSGAVNQRAVVIFHREDSAAAALAADGAEMMGSPVAVMLASGVGRALRSTEGTATHGGVGGGSGASAATGGDAGGRVEVKYFGPSAPIAHLLAQGFLYGHQGVAHVRQFGEAHGLSQRVKVVVDRITTTAGRVNERYQIVPTLNATYEAAAAQAADLDRELHISERVTSVSSFALARAAEWAAIAMRNPAVASTVTAAREFVTQAAAAVQGTVTQAMLEMDARNREAAEGRTPASSPTGGQTSSTPLLSAAGTGTPKAAKQEPEVMPE